MVGPTTAIVSVMAMNNEIGVVQPVAAVGRLCRAAGALFHSDGAQALAVDAIDVDAWSVDLLSLSAHKAYGPKGIGALYVRRDCRSRLRPIMFGGGQEQGLRPGTLPTPLCVGFGAACEILSQEGTDEVSRIRMLRDRLLGRLQQALPDLVVNGSLLSRHPGNLKCASPGLRRSCCSPRRAPHLRRPLDRLALPVRLNPRTCLPPWVWGATEAGESVRLSLGRFTSEERRRRRRLSVQDCG